VKDLALAVVRGVTDPGQALNRLREYISQRPPVKPNLSLLQNALDQTRGTGCQHASDWMDLIRTRLESLNPETLGNDIRPFLERPEDARLLTRDHLLGLLRPSPESNQDDSAEV